MTKQTLSIEQMQHLQELGLDTSNASMCWIKTSNGRGLAFNDEWISRGESLLEPVPAYTLQDVLDLLPKQIGAKYTYDLCILPESISYTQFIEGEMREIIYEIPIGSNLLDSTYEMLCWCIKNGYVKTGKEYKL